MIQVVKSPKESFKFDYLLYIIDQAITVLRNKFEQFKIYADIFGFLFSIKKLKSLDSNNLKEYCLNLERSLKHNNHSDIDELDLSTKLKILREIMQVENDTLIGMLNYIKRIDSFPKNFIAYRIMLTISVSVDWVERSFSKLKLTKSYSSISE